MDNEYTSALPAFPEDFGFHIRIRQRNNEIHNKLEQYNLEKQRDEYSDGTIP
jgi:hypothetical protein